MASPEFKSNFSFHFEANFNRIGPFGTKLMDFKAAEYPLPSEAKFHDRCGGYFISFSEGNIQGRAFTRMSEPFATGTLNPDKFPRVCLSSIIFSNHSQKHNPLISKNKCHAGVYWGQTCRYETVIYVGK